MKSVVTGLMLEFYLFYGNLNILDKLNCKSVELNTAETQIITRLF